MRRLFSKKNAAISNSLFHIPTKKLKETAPKIRMRQIFFFGAKKTEIRQPSVRVSSFNVG